MEELYVKIGKSRVLIERDCFVRLLDLSPIKQYKIYRDALDDDEISFDNLKELARRADVPYPLFFAPTEQVDTQLKDKEKNIFEKIPSKHEMQLVSRGKMKLSDIELIVKDLGRKQEFLKSRILSGAKPNEFLGLVAKDMKSGATNRAIALRIRSFLEIDLSLARGLSKGGVLEYLCRKAEDRGVLVSFSSYNFMPQNIDKEIGVSGFCVKDKKFPYVFINNRDGDEKPIVLETAGRQIFTLTAMLVCVAMNKFVLNTKSGKVKGDPAVRVFSIVGEVLIPKEDVDGLVVTTLADLKECADKFKVTPSMLLMRLRETKRIDTKLADSFKIALKKEIEDAGSKGRPRTPTQTTGYGKYNGERFSREVVRSFKSGKISAEEFRNVLFRKGKMDPSLTSKYSQKYL